MSEIEDVLNKKFLLNPDCFLVKGIKRGALYDLVSGHIYSIDERSSLLLAQCEQGRLISEIVGGDPSSTKDASECLSAVQSLGLGKFFEVTDVLEKISLDPPALELNLLWLQLVHSCNQLCSHCYDNSSPSASVKHATPLSLYDWERVIREGWELGCKRLQFTGGEPLLFGRGIFSLIEFAKNLGYGQIEIFTNATLLTKNDIELLAKHNVRIATNIYSKKPEIHDQITGLKGSFEKTVKNIRLMKEKKMPVYVATVLMGQNEEYREETVDFMQELGEIMPLKHFDIVRPAGRGKSNSVLSENLKTWSQKKNPVFSKIDKGKFIRRKHGHSCWWGVLVVGPDGKVMPCIMAEGIVCGNAKKQSLREVIESDELQKMWRFSKDKVAVCKDCEYRYACLDCRPLAIGKDGKSFHDRGDHCLYNPYTGEWKKTM